MPPLRKKGCMGCGRVTEEGPMTSEYKRGVIFTPCECDGPGVLGGIVMKNDKLCCSSCGKTVKIEKYILFGCPTCEPAKFKELDQVEKEVYGN